MFTESDDLLWVRLMAEPRPGSCAVVSVLGLILRESADVSIHQQARVDYINAAVSIFLDMLNKLVYFWLLSQGESCCSVR